MSDVCCWSNCENPAGGGTHTMIDVPQVGGEPMRATLPVCEDHWYGNWHRERRQLVAEVDLLRRRLASIAALASDDAKPSPNAARPSVDGGKKAQP